MPACKHINHISIIFFFYGILLRLRPSLNNSLFAITQPTPEISVKFLGIFFIYVTFYVIFVFICVTFPIFNQKNILPTNQPTNQPMLVFLHWFTAGKLKVKDGLTYLWQFIAFKIHNRYINLKRFFSLNLIQTYIEATCE